MARKVGIRDEISIAWSGTKSGYKYAQAIANGHEPDWETTAAGRRKPVCSCGWKAPARSKLSHSISDIRDHLLEVYRETVSEATEQMQRRVGQELSERAAKNAPTEDVGVSRTTPSVEHPVANVVFSSGPANASG